MALSNDPLSATDETSKQWCVYMVETLGGRLYTGITNNIERRWKAHCSGKGGAKFFRSDPAQRLAYLESGYDRSGAAKREWDLKSLDRVQKLALISESQNPPPLLINPFL